MIYIILNTYKKIIYNLVNNISLTIKQKKIVEKINFAFNKLKLLKLTALTTNYNISSQRLLKKLRFKIVKRMKRDYFDKKLNKWCDVLEYRL